MRVDEQRARKILQEIFGEKKSILRMNLIQDWLKRGLNIKDLNPGLDLMKGTGEIDEFEMEGDDVRYDLVRMPEPE